MKNKIFYGIKIILLAIVVCFCLIGCGTEKEAETEISKSGLDNAKEAYALLSDSTEMIETIGAGISGAWGYAIETGNDFSGTYKGLAEVSFLSYEEVQAAFEQHNIETLGEEVAKAMANEGVDLCDFQEVLSVLINYAYVPYFEKIDKDLATAKSLIQSVDSSESYYSDLIDYYTAVSNYLEFCKSPTGNYQSVGTTRNEYSTAISSVKSKLSFQLE